MVEISHIDALPEKSGIKSVGITLQIDTGNIIYEEFNNLESAIEFAKKYYQNPQEILQRITPKKKPAPDPSKPDLEPKKSKKSKRTK